MEDEIIKKARSLRNNLFNLNLLCDHFDELMGEINFPGQDEDFTERLNVLLNGNNRGDKGINQVNGDFTRIFRERNQLIGDLDREGFDRREIKLFKRSQIELQKEYNELLPRIEQIREFVDAYVPPPPRDVIQGGQGSEQSLPNQNLLMEVDVIPGSRATVDENEMGTDRVGNLICMICLESAISEGPLCRVDCPARHVFHCGCIRDWVNAPNKFCPLCRPPAQGNTETHYNYMTRVDAAPGLTQIAPVTLSPELQAKCHVPPGSTSFGRGRVLNKIKSVEKIIKYLLKL